MVTQTFIKFSRLYTKSPLKIQELLELPRAQTHYLRNVMRMASGDKIRVFNGQDGEWIAQITDISKKSTILKPIEQIKKQPDPSKPVHLLFTPIKKQRMDFLIEKAVELGATNLHLVLSNRTETRKINEERINAQIIEAAEQCERLDIPTLHPLTKLDLKIIQWPKSTTIMAALEREDAQPLSGIALSQETAFLIGPEGGFDDKEKQLLKDTPYIIPISLGKNILRTETAAIKCLCMISN